MGRRGIARSIPTTDGRTMKPHATPRVLLVEDDPTSRAFLSDVVAQLADVDAVGSGAAALRRIAAGPVFDLWLIDAHLPDSDGRSLLAALRLHAPYTPALAHTADPDPAFAERLRAAGFLEVLVKPIATAAVRAAIIRAWGGQLAVSEAAARPWDEAGALAMLRGQRAQAFQLRALFRAELPRQCVELRAALARGAFERARAVLHRLRGSCVLVGAVALDDAVRALQADPGSDSALRAFDRAVAGVLGAQDPVEVGEQVP